MTKSDTATDTSNSPVHEIPKQYEPLEAQAKWLPFWEERGDFNANPSATKPPHVIMIPLPNVTGALHMGHALNGTLQDLLTRWKRMQGFTALWMPGTDHAGIATQAVVERRMHEQEGLTRHDIGREALVQRIWKWKDEYEKRILGQLKQLGASCDWRRVRFTLDDVCSQAVRRTFFKMFRDRFIFRGKRLVNWDTFLQTAVADDEVYTEEIDGKFWTFNYPVVDEQGNPTGRRISFSTTRPETMLGDTAVCVHPTDERYTDLVGQHVMLPLSNRLIPIIADALLADKELGTGCVKVTPAHDPNDYACGLRNKLPMINILNSNGTINENGGRFQGLPREEAREAVVAEMERLGYFEKVEDRKIPMKFSDRSKTSIEPYLSDQWFVKMDVLAQKAIDAVNEGRVQFFPDRYRTSYLDWLGEKRDWCISRQLWWGHRIPVWSQNVSADHPTATCQKLLEKFGATVTATGTIQFAPTYADSLSGILGDDGTLLISVDGGHPDIEAELSALGFSQDDDVLDTWFSSALWPHATLGWPSQTENPPLANGEVPPQNGSNEVLKYFYPGSVLVTSRDIITLWVARMVLTGLYNMGDIPFKHVHVHPKILDGFGQGMSKSKGNGVDPLDLIQKYGTDGMRFTIASLAGETQDVRLPISYECPHCQTLVPQTLEHQKAKPKDGKKPRIKCTNPKCKKEMQYTSANYDADPGEPVAKMVSERFEYGRNFCNKLWNAVRFSLMNLEGYTPGTIDEQALPIEDRWILSRLATTARDMTDLLGRYQFDVATRMLREFVWNEFCDWYLEMAKPRLRETATKASAQRVLVVVTESILKLLHPFTPFITEELWQRLKLIAPQRGLPKPELAAEACIVANWPSGLDRWIDTSLETRFQRLQSLIVAIRNVRAVYNLSPATDVPVVIRCSQAVADDLKMVNAQFTSLAKANLQSAGPDVSRPQASASFSLGDADGYVPLAGLIDLQAESVRQQKEAEKIRGFINGHEKKLQNQSFIDRAPPEVVDEVRQTLDGLKKQLASIEEVVAQLSGAGNP